jgi:hypothetical protein
MNKKKEEIKYSLGMLFRVIDASSKMKKCIDKNLLKCNLNKEIV